MQRRVRKIKTSKNDLSVYLSMIERKQFFNEGDLYPLESNVIGASSWLAQDPVCLLPFAKRDFYYAIQSGKNYFEIQIANTVCESYLFNLKIYCLMEDRASSIFIELTREHDFSETPFLIGSDISVLHLNIMNTNESIYAFFVHEPKNLIDGRLSSLQISGGYLI